MAKKDAWPTPDPDEVKRAREIFEQDLADEEKEEEGTYTRDQMYEENRRAYEERLAEILKHTQHIPIEDAELGRLLSSGVVSLAVCLNDRDYLVKVRLPKSR